MATIQEIEDGIRRLHKINPQDPRIKQLGEARAKMLAGGGGEAPAKDQSWTGQALDYIGNTYNNFTDPEQWKHALTESPEAKAVMNPLQSGQDLLRTTSDFASLGQTDRVRAGLKGTDYATEKAETDAASGRLGSIDEAVNLGGAFLQPSSAAKYANTVTQKGIIPAIKKAGAYGAENAALSGLEASIKGEEVLPAMVTGGVAGAGGSAAVDAGGKVINKVTGSGGPRYKTDEDFFADADKAPRNTREGKVLNAKKGRLEQARVAQPAGRPAFREIQEQQRTLNSGPLAPGRQEREALAKLANERGPSLTGGAGRILTGGGGLGLHSASKLLGPIGPMLGAVMNVAAEMNPAVRKKNYKAYTDAIRNEGYPRTPDYVDNETIDAWREALAKMSAGSQRGPR